MYHIHYRSVPALAAVIAAALMASAAQAAPYPPFRGAGTPAPPPTKKLPGANCTATGTWFDTDGDGDGSWSKTVNGKCRIPGVWTDLYGYTWTVQKGPHKTLTGSVDFNNIADCPYQVWPLTGQRSSRNSFTVTATNPDGGDDTCVSYFGYTLTIE